jgi:O-antigen biosynthesis protein
MTRGTEVLELGPAAGYFTRILKQSLQCTIDAIEIDAEMAAQARPHCRDIVVADLDALDWSKLFPGRRYDTIIAADVLEHLRSPERALKALRLRLKPGGRLLISLPNIAYAGMIFGLLEDDFRYRAEGLLDRTHLKFFTRTTLEEMLGENGWEITWRGSVGKPLYEAEFHTRIEQWPPALREFVLEHPTRAAYQLLCECGPIAMPLAGEVRATVQEQARASEQFSSRLMWSNSEAEFSFDEGAVAFGVIGAARQSLRWTVPKSATHLRIRLADRPGQLRVHGILVGTESVALSACTLSADAARDETLIVLGSAESWLGLPSREVVAGTVITLECGWPMSSDSLVAARALKLALTQHTEHMHALETDLHSAIEKSNAFERAMLAREALVAERDTLLETRARHIQHLETLVGERDQVIVLRDTQVADGQAHVRHLETLIEEHRTALANLETRLAEKALESDERLRTIQSLRTVSGWLRDVLDRVRRRLGR